MNAKYSRKSWRGGRRLPDARIAGASTAAPCSRMNANWKSRVNGSARSALPARTIR